ncbi:T9SS type A sorting domain-containing protein [Fulvivirga sp. M361]|uniref:T9SS type A sorting domain-containing protein n=1 Tax=Fulvivirga sp. M361 TaxID=2594266 RepID=UPI00117A4959|nr:T9SS type A sorting domain-containing protein [Fulvivirga sp. M361]TRX60620.1 T9SS type A sorting domain-containing protein [Fulvivirga sp. M361]
MDNHPGNGHKNYYRLTQVDYNGQSEQFDIITIDVNIQVDHVPFVYPMPATNVINIVMTNDAALSILNVNGLKLSNHSLKKGKNNVNISGLTKGVYSLNIAGKNSKLIAE